MEGECRPTLRSAAVNPTPTPHRGGRKNLIINFRGYLLTLEKKSLIQKYAEFFSLQLRSNTFFSQLNRLRDIPILNLFYFFPPFPPG